MPEKLKPCPFCGSEAKLLPVPTKYFEGWYHYKVDFKGWRVKCSTVGCISINYPVRIKEKAVAIWNTRKGGTDA